MGPGADRDRREDGRRSSDTYGPQALLDQSYAGASYGVLHKSDQIEGLLGRFLGMFGCRTSSWSVPSYQATTFSSRTTFGTIEDGNEDDAFAHSKLIIMWGWNPAYTFHGGNTFYYMRMAKQRGCKFVLHRSAIHRQRRCLRRLVDPDQAQYRCRDDGRHGLLHLRQQPGRTRTSSTASCRAWIRARCRAGRKASESFKDYLAGHV